MRLLFLLVFLVFPAIALIPGHARASQEMDRILLEKKRVETNLKSLKKQLEDYQGKLKRTMSDEAQSLDALRNIKQQILVNERLMGENQAYLNSLDREIDYLRNELVVNRQSYGRVSNDFQRIAVAAYKHGGDRNAEKLLTSGSVNDVLVRAKYMGFLTRSVHSKVTDLQTSARRLEVARTELERSYHQKEDVIREQQLQLKSYASKRKEKESVLHEIKKNKKRFAAQIRLVQKKQFQLQAKIESLIMAQQELIDKERERERLRELQKQRDRQRRMLEAKRREEDRQRRLALDKQSGSRKNAVSDDKETGPDQESPGKSFREKSGAEQMRLVPDDTAVEIERVSADFDKTYGRLPWPVRNGVVIRRFGTQRDRDLNIVTTSNGIDISVPDNSPVRAVSGGKVAQIAYLPTFGNIVIVRHPKSYLTVYANLARVTVAKGEFIQSQHMIGSSGAMTEGGSIVHFEIWKGKAKQNPEKWLRN